MEDLSAYVSDDHLAVEAFSERGWNVDWVPWTAKQDWSRYEAVLIRSPWDYHKHLRRFVEVLGRIDAVTHLLNPLTLVKWNARKTYLNDLRDRGVAIVPTKFGREVKRGDVDEILSCFGTERVIVKPVVGAGADSTFLLERDASSTHREAVAEAFRDAEFMVQPFIPSVLDEGEYSLIYFDGSFSHSVVKTPKPLDFRVQEELGGTIVHIEAGSDLEHAARKAIEAIDVRPLYARVDLVRAAFGGWLVMELELIEPSLYLRTEPGAASRFARAFHVWMTRKER